MNITCTCCGSNKEPEMFKKDSRKKNGYASICKQCAAGQSSKYYESNREAIRAKPVNLEKKRQSDKESYARHKEKRLAYIKEWMQNNPEKVVSNNATRRARKRQAYPEWLTKQDKIDIRVKYTMAKWLSLTCFQQYHVDHIVPLKGDSVCGLHVPWNLQVLSATENLRKNNHFKG
jgi:hypothetical protein